ncbi:MAG: TonB family protein [Terriglobales bacterium]
MGYQALLFCTDEKLARVVSQLFGELEFAVAPVNDPFAAVKTLMAHHYDAIVIDCENEQSASLLVKGARNSSFNQGSLTIGLVEGQAGVAKAYRMGANLVLTKPINVEQAKGTLRVARGLLRKGAEASSHSAAAPVKPAPAAAFPSTATTSQHPDSVSAHSAVPQHQSTDFSAVPTPVASAPAHAILEETPVLAPPIRVKPWTALGAEPPIGDPESAPAPHPAPPAAATPQTSEAPGKQAAAHANVVPFVAAAAKPHGAASAPAPAKEVVKPAPQPEHIEGKNEEALASAAVLHTPQSSPFAASATMSAGPSFSTATEDAGGSGQKILMGAAAVAVLIIAGYFGWTKFGQSHTAPVLAPSSTSTAPQSAPQSVPQPMPQSTPQSDLHTAASAPSAPTTTHSNSTTAANHIAPSQQTVHAAGNPAPSADRPAISESTQTKSEPSPIIVQPGSVQRPRTPPQTSDEASAAPPSALGMAAPSPAALNGVLNSTAAQPSLGRVRVSQGVSQGLLIKQVQPRYPANALATHTEGAVQIEATIDKEGNVVNPKVLSGPSMLTAAALEAVRQWRYKPYYLDGQPVAIQTQITIRFKAQ